ncbi:MAG: hypothetical protein HUK22_07115, partial [Thermoguttaceae bacterium]|nr:hypothetical protein [Thermoguttaceae bacterium]
PRAAQTDVRARFQCQILGDKTQELQIECDPLYAFSGYCGGDAAEIESIEPPTAQNNVLRILFKTPVSGALTVEADFLAKNFSGVGRAPFPKISVQGARILQNWLALAPAPGVECDRYPEKTLAVETFQSAWNATALDPAATPEEPPLAAFDLREQPERAMVATKLLAPAPNVSTTETVLFKPTQAELKCVAQFDAAGEVFQLSASTPAPFALDSAELFDGDGAPLEKPETIQTDDGLAIIFATPLKGRFVLELSGRSKVALDAAAEFPALKFKNATETRRLVGIYCDSSVYLDFTPGANWTPAGVARAEEIAAPSGDVHRVGAYEIEARARAAEPDPVDPAGETTFTEDETPASFAVRLNTPKVEGRENTWLYKKLDAPWKARVECKLTVRGGRLDRFYFTADDSYELAPLDPNSAFDVAEGTTPSGAPATDSATTTS